MQKSASGAASASGTQRSNIPNAVVVGAGDGTSTHEAFKKKMQEKAKTENNNLW